MRKLIEKSAVLLLPLLAMIMTGCLNEPEPTPIGDTPAAVSFSAYLLNTKDARHTRAGYTGEIDTEQLQASETNGFGVFTTYTGTEDFSSSSLSNFMWNQQVTYSGLGGGVTSWVYSPLKYWPNDNRPADDQDNDTGNNPAQGSGLYGGKLSFFAYAPWVAAGTVASAPASDAAIGEATGIVAMTGNGATVAGTYLTYRLPASRRVSERVDLLWAYPQKNRTKTDGAGYTSGTVDLHFIHALSKLTVRVRALIDHTSPDDHAAEYAGTLHENTRVLIESVSISAPTFHTTGNLYVAPLDATPAVPRWEGLSGSATLDFSSDVDPVLKYAGSLPFNTNNDDASEAKADFDAMTQTGVTEEERSLFADENTAYLVLPDGVAQTLQVTIRYHVVTYDAALTLSDPKYFSHVTNDIVSTATGTITFEPNKFYTLRLLLGLTTVKFEVDVDDWAVPMVLDGVVTPWGEQTKEANVE